MPWSMERRELNAPLVHNDPTFNERGHTFDEWGRLPSRTGVEDLLGHKAERLAEGYMNAHTFDERKAESLAKCHMNTQTFEERMLGS